MFLSKRKKKNKKEKKMYDERARLKEFARLKKISGLSYGYKYFDFFQFNKFLSILSTNEKTARGKNIMRVLNLSITNG